jgi:hypothetical protein
LSLALVIQRYLELLDSLLELYRLLSAQSWTVNALQQASKASAAFVDMYSVVAKSIVVGKHCAKSAKNITSTSFPKLHEVLHFVQFIFLLGPMQEWTTAYMESALRVTLKPSFEQSQKRVKSCATDMLHVARRLELLRFQVLVAFPH